VLHHKQEYNYSDVSPIIGEAIIASSIFSLVILMMVLINYDWREVLTQNIFCVGPLPLHVNMCNSGVHEKDNEMKEEDTKGA